MASAVSRMLRPGTPSAELATAILETFADEVVASGARFAILVLSEEDGAVIREVAPPER